MPVESEAVPSFGIDFTLPEIRVLHRVAGSVLASWLQTENPTPVQLRRQQELRDANTTLQNWLMDNGVRG